MPFQSTGIFLNNEEYKTYTIRDNKWREFILLHTNMKLTAYCESQICWTDVTDVIQSHGQVGKKTSLITEPGTFVLYKISYDVFSIKIHTENTFRYSVNSLVSHSSERERVHVCPLSDFPDLITSCALRIKHLVHYE